MMNDKKDTNVFLLHFLESLNGDESDEAKIMKSLIDFCAFYRFKRGFIYQTDGFRFFLLKETIGDEENILKSRFEMNEMIKRDADNMKSRHKPFYAVRSEETAWDDLDILNFYEVDSLLIRPFTDTEGKIIGFIGFADREEVSPLSDEELQTIHLLLGSLSKEVSIREYKEREVRAHNTLTSIMNNMGIDIYVNSFDSHDMLYANQSMAAPYGGIKHIDGKKCWDALFPGKKG